MLTVPYQAANLKGRVLFTPAESLAEFTPQ